MKLKIRKASLKDLEEIYQIYLDGSIDEGRFQFPNISKKKMEKNLDRKEIKKQLLKELNEKNRLTIVVEICKKVIGFGQAYIEKEEGEEYGGIGRVYIKKKFRKKGLGTELIEFLIKYLKKKKIKKIESYVYIKNHPSLKLHKKFNFKLEEYKLVKKL